MSRSTVPQHLGLILDGNRRWAKQRGLSLLAGHRQGYLNLKDIALYALQRGVRYLSVYAFSTENWERPAGEVKYLMNLMQTVITSEVGWLQENGIRLCWLGSAVGLRPKLVAGIRGVEELTRANSAGTLALCVNYGGQAEIAEAAAGLLRAGVAPDTVTPELMGQYLYAPDLPPLDLIIRTSGEQRLSNFMLWRAAYAELIFSPKLWPAFTPDDLDAAFTEYAARRRRYGR